MRDVVKVKDDPKARKRLNTIIKTVAEPESAKAGTIIGHGKSSMAGQDLGVVGKYGTDDIAARSSTTAERSSSLYRANRIGVHVCGSPRRPVLFLPSR